MANDGSRRVLITIVTGQDASYLADFLLEKGYEVSGEVRRSSTEIFERIANLRDKMTLAQADLIDQVSMIEAVGDIKPHEVYNVAAQSFLPTLLDAAYFDGGCDGAWGDAYA